MFQRVLSSKSGYIAVIACFLAVALFITPTGLFYGTGGSHQQDTPQSAGALPAYSVSFEETGLPSVGSGNAVWAVTFNNSTERSDTGVISFSVQDGTYNYTVENISGFSSNPRHGAVTVNSSNVAVQIAFSSTYYKVTFAQSGLLTGANWQVTVDNLAERTNGSSIAFNLKNGNYSFSISKTAGYNPAVSSWKFSVSGNNLAIPVKFISNLERISFFETGLPSGTQWEVSITGVTNSTNSYSTDPSIVFSLPNGTYSYDVHLSTQSNRNGVVAFFPTPASGTVYSNNSYHNITVVFTKGYNTLYFNETGLPRTSASNVSMWSVNLSGIVQTANTSSMLFYVADGTYNFSIPSVGGYLYLYPAKSITVSSNVYSEPVLFVQNYSYVKFIAKTLPQGTNFVWGAAIGGINEITANNTLVFTVPASQPFLYSVLANPDFSPLATNNSGTGTSRAAGGVYLINLSFVGSVKPSGTLGIQNDNEIQFFGLGLPYGAGYSVTLNASNRNQTGSSGSGGLLTFTDLSSGSYVYWISSTSGYIPIVRSGVVDLSVSYTSVNVTFKPLTFKVNFTESGLPSGISWSVGLNSFYHGTTSYPSDTLGDITAHLSNGSYYYFAQPVKANGTVYYPTNRSKFFYVNGPGTRINIKFISSEYPVKFVEHGLPAGIPWAVNISGALHNSNSTGTVTANLLNGTYPYIILGQPGYMANVSAGIVGINGSAETVSIQFYSVSYSVSFVESGLPVNTNWHVLVSGVSYSSFGTGVVSVELENGSYPYVVPNELTYYVSNVSEGHIMVNGSQVGSVIYLNFHSVRDELTIMEAGLPSGIAWDYSISGSSPSTVIANYTALYLQNGSYTLSFEPSFDSFSGLTYYPIQSVIPISLSSPDIVTVNFSAFVYPIVIAESGLPANASWSAIVDQKTYHSQSSQISISLPNGTYSYYVPNVYVNYYPNVRDGNVTVAGNSVNLPIKFHEQNYTVMFQETGIGSGVNWNVTVSNSTVTLAKSTAASSIEYSLPNGSYSYKIASSNRDYAPTNYSGSLDVSGAAVTVNETFIAYEFSVVFRETGLATLTLWSVTFNGKQYSQWSNNSTTITISHLFNGTYTYSVSLVSGYNETSTPQSPFNVTGKNVTVPIYYTSTTPSYQPPPKSSGFHLPGYAIIVIVAVAVVGIAVGIAVVASQRRKRL